MKTILLDTSIDYTSWDINEAGSIKMAEWQPIETAPRGQYVLIAFYWKKNSHWYDPSENWDIGCGTYHGGRYVDQIHIDLEDMDAMWMPLPPPPKKGDE